MNSLKVKLSQRGIHSKWLFGKSYKASGNSESCVLPQENYAPRLARLKDHFRTFEFAEHNLQKLFLMFNLWAKVCF